MLCNVSDGEDGSTGSLDARELFRPQMKMALGALFRAELSKQLQALGLRSYRPLNQRGDPVSWFELDAVPKELVDHFSKRRKQIEAWLDQKGAYGAKAAEKAAKLTRENKENWNRAELVTAWQETGREFGFHAETGKTFLLSVGQYETIELMHSNPTGLNPRNTSQAEHLTKKETTLPSELYTIPITTPENGLSGYFIDPESGASRESVTGSTFKSVMFKASSTSTHMITQQPESTQNLRPWGNHDRRRLELEPATCGKALCYEPSLVCHPLPVGRSKFVKQVSSYSKSVD